MLLRALVFSDRPGDRYRAGRTIRSLRAAGVACDNVCDWPPAAITEVLPDGPVWLLRAGAWLNNPRPVPPRASATGLPVAAVGRVPACPACPRAEAEALAWERACIENGGDFSVGTLRVANLPALASIYLDAHLTACIAERLNDRGSLAAAILAELEQPKRRVLHHAPIDVRDDAG